MIGLGVCIQYAVQNGDIKRLTALPDYEGNICGENGQGQYLYFCQSASILDLHHQICINSCPVDSSTSVYCRYTQSQQAAYATHPVAGMLCLPTDAGLLAQVKTLFNSNAYLHSAAEFASIASEPEILVMGAVLSGLLSFTYLFLIHCCAQVFVWISLVIAIIVPGGLGGGLLYEALSGNYWTIDSVTLTTGSYNNDLVLGGSLTAAAVIVLLLVVFKASTIERATQTIEEAAECIVSMPVLVIEPWISTVVKAVVFMLGLMGFLLLNMAGDTASSVDLTSSDPLYNANKIVTVIIIYYVVAWIWVMELIHAISQFVIIYTAEVWYFRQQGAGDSFLGGFSIYDMLKGFFAGIFYHIGTLMFGSFMMTIFRVLRIIAGVLVQSSEESGNPVAACAAKILLCCVSCIEYVMKYVTNLSYMDTAMNATNYCDGCQHAVELVANNAGTMAAVEGITYFLSFGGVAAVSAGTGAATWILVTTVPRYSDSTSSNYVSDPSTAIATTAVIGAVVAIPFMHLFDIIADTMVYCDSIGNSRLPQQLADVGSFFSNWFGSGTGH